MATYRIDLDLLEETKNTYANAEEIINADIEIAKTVVNSIGNDMYLGEDADTFQNDFTGYINEDMTDALGNVRAIKTILENGLDDGRTCKKLCHDFLNVLGGSSEKSKEEMVGMLFCEQAVIASMQVACKEAVTYAENIRIGANAIDNILDELRMVSMDSTTYTDSIRNGCDKVDKLENFSSALTTYASTVESMNDYLKIGLNNCTTFNVSTISYEVQNLTDIEIVNSEVIKDIEKERASFKQQDNEIKKYIEENNIYVINVTNREGQVSFIKSILEGAIEEELVNEIPWQITIAQAALETGWGTTEMIDIYTGRKSNNLFGIKYFGADSKCEEYVRVWTTEFVMQEELDYWEKEQEKWAKEGEPIEIMLQTEEGVKIKIIQPFQVFDSPNESITAHSIVLQEQYYENAKIYKNNPYLYAKEIAINYATDPEYANKLIQIIDKYMEWEDKESDKAAITY